MITSETARPPTVSPASIVPPAARPRKARVLIVDDDANLSRLAGMILEHTGKYEVLIVNQSVRAFFAARQFLPDLALLDVDMPGKDGGEVAREFSQDPALRSMPILFLTGLVSRAESGSKEVHSGGMKFISKPVEPQLLLSSVEKELRLPRAP